MKKLSALAALLCFAAPPDSFAAVTSARFVCGADVSRVTETESAGDLFLSDIGVRRDCFDILRDCGLGAVRLAVLVDPSASGGWCGAQDTILKAGRARAAGLDVMIAFHYSDSFATAARQDVPAAWRDFDSARMVEAVSGHTADVLARLKAKSIRPRWIQIGNAVSDGMLWPVARASLHPETFAACFIAGAEAARKAFPGAEIVVHFDRGHDAALFDRNLRILEAAHAHWDVAACSFFPHLWTAEGPDAEALQKETFANLRRIADEWNRGTMIVETGFECSPAHYLEGRRRLLALLLAARNERHCRGVFYFRPECRPRRSGYRYGAFDDMGRPTPIMEAFPECARPAPR